MTAALVLLLGIGVTLAVAPPFSEYCRHLQQEIQGRKYGFHAGNVTDYVGVEIGGFHASWEMKEHETLGLTHPFYHDLHSCGVGLVQSHGKEHDNTGLGNDFSGWEFNKGTRILSDDDLAAVIQDPPNEIHVLHVDGSPVGFAELDRRQADEIELVQFGLMPEFIGQGLGSWFLKWTIDEAWSHQPKRFWLHTCTLDHAAAVPTYKKAGFVQYRQDEIRREL